MRAYRSSNAAYLTKSGQDIRQRGRTRMRITEEKQWPKLLQILGNRGDMGGFYFTARSNYGRARGVSAHYNGRKRICAAGTSHAAKTNGRRAKFPLALLMLRSPYIEFPADETSRR